MIRRGTLHSSLKLNETLCCGGFGLSKTGTTLRVFVLKLSVVNKLAIWPSSPTPKSAMSIGAWREMTNSYSFAASIGPSSAGILRNFGPLAEMREINARWIARSLRSASPTGTHRSSANEIVTESHLICATSINEMILVIDRPPDRTKWHDPFNAMI
jgi:hypothetical protein